MGCMMVVGSIALGSIGAYGHCIGQGRRERVITRIAKAIILATTVFLFGYFLIKIDIALHKHHWSDYRCSPTFLRQLDQWGQISSLLCIFAALVKWMYEQCGDPDVPPIILPPELNVPPIILPPEPPANRVWRKGFVPFSGSEGNRIGDLK